MIEEKRERLQALKNRKKVVETELALKQEELNEITEGLKLKPDSIFYDEFLDKKKNKLLKKNMKKLRKKFPDELNEQNQYSIPRESILTRN